MYGFACYLSDERRKNMTLPKQYAEWITNFNYPVGYVKIRTMHRDVFTVKIFPLGNQYYMYNGWFTMTQTLQIPSRSWLIFQYEEALQSFRMFYFYQDIALAPSDYFYYRANGPFDLPDVMHINRFFVHHKLLDTIPYYPVVINGPGKKIRIKKELSITDDHLVAFEMIDLHNFNMTVFNVSTCELVYPPELCAMVKEEEVEEVIEISDTGSVHDMVNVNEVDDHYRLRKRQAVDLGLNRKVNLMIVDAAGDFWDVHVDIETLADQKRYYVKRMKNFVKAKYTGSGEVFTLHFVKGERKLLFI